MTVYTKEPTIQEQRAENLEALAELETAWVFSPGDQAALDARIRWHRNRLSRQGLTADVLDEAVLSAVSADTPRDSRLGKAIFLAAVCRRFADHLREMLNEDGSTKVAMAG